jgi:hypothetical protein
MSFGARPRLPFTCDAYYSDSLGSWRNGVRRHWQPGFARRIRKPRSPTALEIRETAKPLNLLQEGRLQDSLAPPLLSRRTIEKVLGRIIHQYLGLIQIAARRWLPANRIEALNVGNPTEQAIARRRFNKKQ